MTIKLALIGAGRIAKVHAQAIAGSADAELAAVSDALPAAAEALARASGATPMPTLLKNSRKPASTSFAKSLSISILPGPKRWSRLPGRRV